MARRARVSGVPSDRSRGMEQCDDPTTLRTLIDLHAPRARPLSILDVTSADGKMWRGLDYAVTSLDANGDLDVDYVGDFRDLSNVRDRQGKPGAIQDGSVDVVVFDPPHRTESGTTSVYAKRFGLINPELQVADIAFYFAPFLAEARRVLRQDGVLLAKIGDQVHRNKRRWQPFMFWQAANATPGLHPCDVRVQGRIRGEFAYEGRVMHLATNYVCWFVIRRSNRCTRDR